jgi:hypothetical protein
MDPIRTYFSFIITRFIQLLVMPGTLTTIPAHLQKSFGDCHYILVVKDQLAFHHEEDENATTEDHQKWFSQFWWKRPAAVVFYDTKEEAIEQGIITPHPYWWIVFDREGKEVDGGY